MNKKLAIIAVICTISIILGGINTSMLYGTSFLESKPGYSFAVSDAADWWDCNWSYCKRITIDHTKVQSDQTDFPVLLNRSSDNDLATYAQSDGDDIAFVNAYNTSQYEHEIEEYDSATGELTVWVEVSSISNTVDTILYMYYGNPDCGSQQNITETWNSNYIMVQHLDESAGTIYDSTSFDNDGTNSGALPNSSAKIDGGYDFDGNADINCGANDSLNITSQITLEGWVKDPPLLNEREETNNIYIVDKRDEKLPVMPGKSFTVSRTITADYDADAIFVALFSPGIKIKDMGIKGSSMLADYCNAGRTKSDEEIAIENIRNKLPKKLKELEMIAYSKPFTVKDDEVEIEMTFETEKINNLLDNGRISYLVFSSDTCYDFESTTYLSYPLGLTDWLNPFSIFESIIDFLTEQDSIDDATGGLTDETFVPTKQHNGIINQAVEWTAPQISKQAFEIVIETSEHLDEYREFISDIYDEVYQLDDIWSETIPTWHYIRVTFDTPLDNTRDITLYPRIVSGAPRIEIYEADGNEIIAEFENLTSYELNKVYLTGLNGNQDTFDLLVLDGEIEIDYIVDPDITVHIDWQITTVEDTSPGTYTEIATISGATLSANTDYLLWASFGMSSDGGEVNFRLSGDGGALFEGVVEPPGTADDAKQQDYVRKYTTDASPADVVMDFDPISGDAGAANSWLLLIDLTDLTENDDYFYNEDNAANVLNGWEDGASVTLTTADGSRDWFVIASCAQYVLDENAGEFQMRIEQGASNYMEMRVEGEEDGNNEELTWAVHRTFDDVAADTTFNVGVGSDVDNDQRHDSSAIFALNLDAFGSHDSTYDGTGATTIPSPMGEIDSLSYVPTTTGNTLIFSHYIAECDNLASGWEDELTIGGVVNPTGWDWSQAPPVRKTAHDANDQWPDNIFSYGSIDTGGATLSLRADDLSGNMGEALEMSITAFSQKLASVPAVITNESTGVEETNATLKGWLQSNGGRDTTCYLLLNDTNDFGSPIFNLSKGVIANNAEFSNDTAGETTLTQGTLYYFDTKANNSVGWNESGGVQMFLTKPENISSFTATAISGTQIDLSWTDEAGGDGAYIEYALNSPPSPWNEGDGTPMLRMVVGQVVEIKLLQEVMQ